MSVYVSVCVLSMYFKTNTVPYVMFLESKCLFCSVEECVQSRGSLTIRTFRVCRSTPAVTWASSSERATDRSDDTTDPSRQPTS